MAEAPTDVGVPGAIAVSNDGARIVTLHGLEEILVGACPCSLGPRRKRQQPERLQREPPPHAGCSSGGTPNKRSKLALVMRPISSALTPHSAANCAATCGT